MPTYEYVCLKCRKSFDAFQRIADAPLELCPREICPKAKWGKGRVKRGIGGGAGLIFKGGGFYITDYRSQAYQAAAAKDSPSKEAKPPATSPVVGKPAAPG